jgi:hypothetical protein
VRKIALGAVVALLLAAFPLAAATTTAGAVNATATSTVHVYWVGGVITANIFVDGTQATFTNVSPYTSRDVTNLAAGIHTIIACPVGDSLSGAVCSSGDTTGYGGNVQIMANGYYTLVLTDGTVNWFGHNESDLFSEDTSVTPNQMTRVTYENASDFGSFLSQFGAGANSICVNQLTKSDPGIFDDEQANPFLVPAAQSNTIGFGEFSDACQAPVFTIPGITFPGGSNVVITLVNACIGSPICLAPVGFNAFSDGYFKPLFNIIDVGQETVPNKPDTADFCKAIVGLPGIQTALKDLIGLVVPGDSNTYPSVGEMKTFVDDTQAILDAGDASVPGTVAPQWQLATASIRSLLFGFTAIGYNWALLPVASQTALVLGVNGGSIPGITPDLLTVSAGTVLTDFYLSECVPPAPPGPAPAPAPTPVSNVSPRFTG